MIFSLIPVHFGEILERKQKFKMAEKDNFIHYFYINKQ